MVEKRTAELLLAKEKAEESDRLKSAFLANMSHEIRTPLNGIVGFLGFIEADNLPPSRRKEYIKVINNSSRQLAKIIDDIIDISKIEAQQMTICPVPIELNSLMNELRMLFETYIQGSNKESIELILDDSGFIDPCVISVDAVRLRQMLNNLIGNAMKFTKKGFIRFGYRKSAPNQLEFWVEDSGIGLSPDKQEVIFERFRQAEITNQYGGTGLGLAISRSLVHLMGGKMWVESTEGSGSSFYFTTPYIPLAPEDVNIFEETQTQDNNYKPFTGKSILLLVEPIPPKVKYYEKLISAMGATVVKAETLHEWLDIVYPIDLVIADASLLNKRDFDNIPNLPTVLIVPDKKKKNLQKQFSAIIEMPVSYDEILRVMERSLKL
jgi:nitrogen-specific signal transduction histidine kinase